MSGLKIKFAAKKAWLWAKKFWWAIVLGLLFVVVALFGALTRNGAYLGALLDFLENKKLSHDEEIETLTRVHETEIADKAARLEEHLKRRAQLEEEFKKRGETLDKQKKAQLKKMIDESYTDPEKLAKELAEAFGIK